MLFLVVNRDPYRDQFIPGGEGLTVREMANRLGELEAKESEFDRTTWRKERLAEQCGLLFDQLWDLLNTATNKLDVLRSFSPGELIVARYGLPKSLGHGIKSHDPADPGPLWNSEMWRRFLEQRQREGWELAQVEFRHNRFDTEADGRPKRSAYYFSAHLTNPVRNARAVLDGELTVDWMPALTPEGLTTLKRVDASRVRIRTRQGDPGFRPVLVEELAPPPGSYFIDPLILYDLDGDGRSEIILAAKNLVYRQRAGDRFEAEPLCRHSPGLIFTGVIADFDGDGAADFLCASFEGLTLFRGSAQGAFDEPGRYVWRTDPHLKYGQVLTCGDIDGDGDLDVWLGQYKAPYVRGQMPAPYYDANDGQPSFLLLNDGKGNLSDATIASGLAAKRWRRSYSGSFADLDGDGDLDLAVVSDFAGIDLYANDGLGHFREVTREWIGEARGFGMAHTLADFNADGRLDLLMIGMNSPTADRLENLGLTRAPDKEASGVRQAMTFGNRLFLGHEGTPFSNPSSLGASIARSGWSWGCGAFDFDNDGFPDVYIANGHESKQSVREYEPEFWLHDIFVTDSKDSMLAMAYFGAKSARTRGRGHSYGGYEKNRLFWNRQGESFLEIGHLMGVALEADSRNVVADDLDGDGRLDLLVTTFEVWPKTRQTLHVFKNSLATEGNWIGFRFREQGGGRSPIGARVTIRHAGGAAMRQIVTGDSYRSQQANTLHFGLGKITSVDSAEIRWTNGQTTRLRQPAINAYVNVSYPDR